MQRSTALSFCVASVFLASCANVQVRRVTSENQPGIRYWRPAPYLAYVETRTDNGVICDVKAFMLPDKTEEYAITMSAGFGTVKANPTLENGWNLTSLDTNIESKTSDNLTALATLLKLGLPAGGNKSAIAPAGAVSTCRGVVKVDYDATGRFKGFTPIW